MSLVNEMYANFCKKAQCIPGFKVGQKEDVEYDITYLANKYIQAEDNNDQEGMNRYISALMVRYWHMVPYLYEKSKSSKLGMEDMVTWLYEGFAKAFKYRSWLDPNKEVSKDPKGAEKCINQCITSVRQYHYHHFNTAISKINYISTSLDALYETLGDSFDDEVPQEELYGSDVTCREIIDSLVREGKIFDAIVIDRICFGDVFTENKSKKKMKLMTDEGELLEDVNSYSYSLNPKKLSSCLKSITKDYIMNFSEVYNINPSKIEDVLKKYTKKNVTKNINDVLIRTRDNKKVVGLIC